MNHSSSIVFGLVSLVCCLQSVIFCLESCVCCLWSANGPSTSVENPLQTSSFMQNKPNFLDAQMNVNNSNKMIYKKFIPLAGQKNKPNPSGLRCLLRSCRTDQTQSKPVQSAVEWANLYSCHYCRIYIYSTGWPVGGMRRRWYWLNWRRIPRLGILSRRFNEKGKL